MAIYHLNAKIISRGKGQSAIAAAAYRSGERLRDEQTNEQKFYQARAERILFTTILAPKEAPEWASDRNQLWNHAERSERRKDAQLAREIEISLPHELTEPQREWLVKDFAREAFVRKGYAVDVAIHAPDKDSDGRNHHAHLMVTRRTLGPEGFARTKDWQFDKKQLGAWREQWAHLANRHLERHGYAARIDHRSHQTRGVEQEPTVHLGYAAAEMDARGAPSDRADQLRAVITRNEIRFDMKGIDSELAQLEAERQRQRLTTPERALDWTDHAGMVAQQHSAMNSLRHHDGRQGPGVRPAERQAEKSWPTPHVTPPFQAKAPAPPLQPPPARPIEPPEVLREPPPQPIPAHEKFTREPQEKFTRDRDTPRGGRDRDRGDRTR